MKYLQDRASAISPKEDFENLLNSKKSLRIKLGVDPTAPDVTLGWYAILRALRKFQEYGHTAVLILVNLQLSGRPFWQVRTRSN